MIQTYLQLRVNLWHDGGSKSPIYRLRSDKQQSNKINKNNWTKIQNNQITTNYQKFIPFITHQKIVKKWYWIIFEKRTWVNSSSPLLLSSQSDLFRAARRLRLELISWRRFLVRDALFVRLYGVRDDRTFCRRTPGDNTLCRTYDYTTQWHMH